MKDLGGTLELSLLWQEYILTMNEKENMTLRAHSGKAWSRLHYPFSFLVAEKTPFLLHAPIYSTELILGSGHSSRIVLDSLDGITQLLANDCKSTCHMESLLHLNNKIHILEIVEPPSVWVSEQMPNVSEK